MATLARQRLFYAGIFLAAVVYNLWPLGYILNPRVTRIGLTSDLGAKGQPYNWLFIASDVICGLLVLWVVWQIRQMGYESKRARIALYGLAAFGVMTAVSALLPLDCHTSIQTCGYGPGQPLGWHDVTGAIAALGLFTAMAATLSSYSQRNRWLKNSSHFLIWFWSLWGLWFLYVSLANNRFLGSVIVPSQQFFLILSGLLLCLAAYGWSSSVGEK